MSKADIKKQQILNQVADYVLLNGIKATSLRSLAATVGTSDRMLLHYFINKEALMTAALTTVATRMIALLDHTSLTPMPFTQLIPRLADMLTYPSMRPYLRLWLELAAVSATDTFYRPITHEISERFAEWIASLVQVEHEEERRPIAALAFALLEGCVVLDAFGQTKLIASALQGITILYDLP